VKKKNKQIIKYYKQGTTYDTLEYLKEVNGKVHSVYFTDPDSGWHNQWVRNKKYSFLEKYADAKEISYEDLMVELL